MQQDKEYLIYTTKGRSLALQMVFGFVFPFILLMVYIPKIEIIWFFFGGAVVWFFLLKYLIRSTLAIPIRISLTNDRIKFEFLYRDLGGVKKTILIQLKDIARFSDYDIGAETCNFNIFLHNRQVLRLKKDVRFSKKDDIVALTEDFSKRLKAFNAAAVDGSAPSAEKIKFGDDTYLDYSRWLFIGAFLFVIWPVSTLINKEFEFMHLVPTLIGVVFGILYSRTHQRRKTKDNQ